MNKTFISICIPSYNRPDELIRGLRSIDGSPEDIEIIIREDKSPKREEVRSKVSRWKAESSYQVEYIENDVNLGYDRNLQALAKTAKGDWVIFLADDDAFIPGALDKLRSFLKEHLDLGYVLRSYVVEYKNGKTEQFRYYDQDVFFKAGPESYVTLFRKSVFISGFTIKRELVLPYLVGDFDGTLLFQLYLASEVAMKHTSAYFNTPLTKQFEGGVPFFGNAEAEKALYVPGKATVQNSINFLSGYFRLTEFMDKKYNLDSTKAIKKDMSKYMYPSLSIQRHRGVLTFLDYVKQLNRLGFNCTPYYYIYVWSLVVLGKRLCDNAIRIIKNVLGKTPEL